MQNNKITLKNGITIEVKDVTPVMARDVLANHNGINRKINESHWRALMRNMENKTWRFNGDTIRFNKDGDLIDGQHRLTALSKCDKTLPMIIIKGFDKEVIKTIDQEIKPRNLGDLLSMDGVKNANNVASCINRYLGMKYSFSFISGRGSGTGATAGKVQDKITLDEKYNEYYNHASFYDDTVVYARQCYSKLRIISLAEIAAIYTFLYFEKHHSDAEIQGFFDRLFFTQTDCHVINLLRNIFINDGLKKNPMTSQTKSGLLTKTWNYYIKGKDVKVLSYNKNNEGVIEFI